MPVVTRMDVPLTRPTLGEDERRAVLEVLDSGWLVQGARVAEFERRIAEYCGARHAIATTNCTTALQLALDGLALRPGDEVIVPSFTFVASANAIIHAGGTPRFVDVEPDTWNIDPASAEAAITPRTRAIMPVDQFGLAADLHGIARLAKAHNLAIVEDAAPALGARIGDRRVGSISPVTCFSFHPRKSITTAEGGMIVTDDDATAERARMMRSHAASSSDLSRHQAAGVEIEEYPEAGFNFRMSDLHAALGLAQLGKLEQFIDARRRLAARYDEAFAPLDGVTTSAAREGWYHTYQTYCVVLGDDVRLSQQEVMNRLKEVGVTTRRSCMAIHLEPYARRMFGEVALPVAERLTERAIAIPLYPTMTDDEQAYVIEQVRRLLT